MSIGTGFKQQMAWEISDLNEDISYREALAIVNAVFDSIRDALRRHEAVELPFGTFRVVPYRDPQNRNPHRGRGWRFGRVVKFGQAKYTVEFEPAGELS